MNAIARYLAEHGGLLIFGATGLLALGCLGAALCRSPIHRQRAGEAAMLGVLVWAVLAMIPLPRLSFSPTDSQRGDALSAPVATTTAPLRVETVQERTAETRDSPAVASRALVPERSVLAGVPRKPASFSTKASGGKESELSGRPETVPPTVAAGWKPAPPEASLGVRETFALAYLAGFAACAGWLALGRAFLVRIVWAAARPEPWICDLCRQLLPAGARQPRLLVTRATGRALSFGLWRPTILLPESLSATDRSEVLRHVLLHELAHLRRRDAWGQLLFNLAFPLLYFHPLYWWLRGQVHLAAELIADDQAAGQAGREEYVGSLVAIARQRGGPLLAFRSHGVFRSPSQFFRRMKMLLARESRLVDRCSWRCRLLFPTAALAVVAILTAMVGVRAGEGPKGPEVKAESGLADAPASARSVPAPSPAARPSPSATFTPRLPAIIAAPAAPASIDAERDQLRQERDALQQQLRRLQDQLKELENRLRPMPSGAALGPAASGPTMPYPASPSDNALRASSSAGPSLRASVGDPFGAPRTGSATASNFAAPAYSAAAPRAVAGSSLADTGPIDVVSLANSHVEAARDLSIARLQHERLQQLQKLAVASSEEAEIAAIRFKAAQRRVALLERIARTALDASKLECEMLGERLKAWEAAGVMSPTQIMELKIQAARAKARVEILEEVLAAKAAEPSTVPGGRSAEPNLAPPKAAPVTPKTAPTGRAAPPASLDSPEGTVYKFLEAVRTGDEGQTLAMLTSLARRRLDGMNIVVAPKASSTARFDLGTVKQIDHGHNEVTSRWIDIFDGREKPQEVVWAVRREPEGWRIHGMAASIREGEPVTRLDLENPQDAMERLSKAMRDKQR